MLLRLPVGTAHVDGLRLHLCPAAFNGLLFILWVASEAQCDDTHKGKPTNPEINMSHRHFSTTTDNGAKTGPRGDWPATNRLSHTTAFLHILIFLICCVGRII
jgi:hypothetical protein